jgi:hypothetical protein
MAAVRRMGVVRRLQGPAMIGVGVHSGSLSGMDPATEL